MTISQQKRLYPIPTKWNILLASVILVLNLFQYFIVPLYLLPIDIRWAWVLIPIAFTNNTFWSLIHESIHSMFHPKNAVNKRWGRFMSIGFGTSFHIVQYSHLMHHRFNRYWESELYDPTKETWLKRAPSYYFYIFGGLYLMELIASLLVSILPQHVSFKIMHKKFDDKPHTDGLGEITERYFAKPGRINNIRVDTLAFLVIFSLSVMAYGECWFFFLAIIAARAFAVSFFDNVYHYATPENHITYAKGLALPRPISAFMLFFNLHHTHHLAPNVPWIHLPHHPDIEKIQEGFGMAACKQLLGPVPYHRMEQIKPSLTP